MYYYEEKEKRYICNYKNKNNEYKKISYSINSYGKYAKKLIELSDKTHIRYNNYITFKGDDLIIHLYSKKYGYIKAYADKKFYNTVSQYRWSLKKCLNTFYCHSAINKKGKKTSLTLHRLLLKHKICNNDLIDHI